MPTVNTAEVKPVQIAVTVAGLGGMDEATARKLALSIRDGVASHLGYYGEDQRESVEVTLTADGAAVEPDADAEVDPEVETPEPDPETTEPENEPVAKATDDEIAAMTPEQYRVAKAAGRI